MTRQMFDDSLNSTPTLESRNIFAVCDYDLAATLNSGQAFRWTADGAGWMGVVGSNWVRLEPGPDSILAETAGPVDRWDWLTHYLQLELDYPQMLAGFPKDEPMHAAISACRGLRLLRQDPWECLASFILSSTKQIVQIRQIIANLCQRFGKPLAVPHGQPAVCTFPTPESLASATEAELRECKMGFRAPYLRETARLIAEGNFNLAELHSLPLAEARARLLTLPGVGRKIADCVMLFAYGFPAAFPVDVWVARALGELYFPRRRPTRQKLELFIETHFGPHPGYAQQYLFHYMRTRNKKGNQGIAKGVD